MYDEDCVSVTDFLAALDWGEQKIKLFLQPRSLPKPFLTPVLLDKWESILWHLNFLVKALTPDVETMAKHLREKDIENLSIVSNSLNRYLCTLNAVRKPSKLTTENVQKIYTKILSGESASRIAEEFGVTKRTVYLIKSGAIHSQILP